MEPLAGFALGLAGSLHCVGMCGPIVLAVQRTATSEPRTAIGGPRRAVAGWMSGIELRAVSEKLQYQVGRVLTYSVLGAIVGLTASVFTLAGIGRLVTIVSGLLMIAFALAELLFQRGVVPQSIAERWSGSINRLYKRASGERREFGTRHFLLGSLNGLLPCGLVTSALMGAVSMGSPTEGALFMAFFGLGTMPLLLAVSIAGVSLSCKLRARLRIALPSFALLLGTLILLRGMALGVPFISPAPPTATHTCAADNGTICR